MPILRRLTPEMMIAMLERRHAGSRDEADPRRGRDRSHDGQRHRLVHGASCGRRPPGEPNGSRRRSRRWHPRLTASDGSSSWPRRKRSRASSAPSRVRADVAGRRQHRDVVLPGLPREELLRLGRLREGALGSRDAGDRGRARLRRSARACTRVGRDSFGARAGAARSRNAARPASNRRRAGPLGADRDDRSGEAERRTLAGDVAAASCACSKRWCARRRQTDARRCEPPRRGSWTVSARARLHDMSRSTSGPSLTRTSNDSINSVSLLGPGVVRSLADALASEENAVAIRRLGNLAAQLRRRWPALGRAAEELAQSGSASNRDHTAPRAGGQEALLELASMLGDADPQVQRESIHAIVEIGTTNAYAVLHRLLLEADTPRDIGAARAAQPARRQGRPAVLLRHREGETTRKADRHPSLDDRSARHDATSPRVDSYAATGSPSRELVVALPDHGAAASRGGGAAPPRDA